MAGFRPLATINSFDKFFVIAIAVITFGFSLIPKGFISAYKARFAFLIADIYKKYYEKRWAMKYMNARLCPLKLSITTYFSFGLLSKAFDKKVGEA